MISRITNLCCSALLMIVITLSAVCEEVDIENATTPTRLIDLLPEGGIDVVDIDAWTITTISGREGRGVTSETYTRSRIRSVDGKLVVELQTGRPAPHGMLTLKRFVYTAEGQLEAYYEIRESRGNRTADMIGRVEDGELVIEPNPEVGVLNANLSRTRRVPMETFETHVPVAWLPLVRAYHIRKGHLGYQVNTVDLTRSADKITRSIEDVGSETIEVDGQAVTAHLLLETTSRERRGQTVTTSAQTMAQQNGALVSSQSKQGAYTYTTQRKAEQTVREKFGLEDEAAE